MKKYELTKVGAAKKYELTNEKYELTRYELVKVRVDHKPKKTTIKCQMSSKFCQIRPRTAAIAALQFLKKIP